MTILFHEIGIIQPITNITPFPFLVTNLIKWFQKNIYIPPAYLEQGKWKLKILNFDSLDHKYHHYPKYFTTSDPE